MIELPISESTAAALSAQAAAHGLTVDAFLQTVLLRVPPAPLSQLSRDELERLLDELATTGHSHAGTFSRAELYSDHD